MRLSRGIVCECEGASACPDGAANGTCVTQPGGYCFVAVEEVLGDGGLLELERTAGCLPPDESGLMQCKSAQVPHQHPKMIECCYESDLCNRRLRPQLPEPPVEASAPEGARAGGGGAAPALLVAAALGVALLAFVAAAAVLCRRRRAGKRPPSPPHAPRAPDASSGSGAGLPLLVQRTVAKQIQMIESVGKGRFGEVWLARWRGERVAVKVFLTGEEAAWFRETEIYQTVPMRHENILGFVASDVRGSGSWTQMLLITDYHERGTLREFLRAAVLDERALAALAHSLAAGLAHLHADVRGARGKPPVAHRDLCAENVMVKRDGTCAIGGFGLAARPAPGREEAEAPAARPGARYAPPELLAGTLDARDMDALRRADVYALALVLWELARRAAAGGPLEPAAPPFAELAPCARGREPSHAEMAELVVRRGARPALPARWRAAGGPLAALAALLPECWHASPPVRLTALRVKKTLARYRAERAPAKFV